MKKKTVTIETLLNGSSHTFNEFKKCKVHVPKLHTLKKTATGKQQDIIMTNTEIKNNLINFYSYDNWGSDWGVKDDELKEKTISALDKMGYEKVSKLLAELFNEEFLNDEKIKEGYGWEDVKKFLDWYEEYGTYPDNY